MDLTAVAKQFLEQYYGAMMQNRKGLLNFYNDNSNLTYNGDKFKGLKEISEKV